MRKYPVGMIECPKCEGRRYVLPPVAAQPGDTPVWEDETKPPRTVWCHNCDARGFVPSKETIGMLQALAAAEETGWLEDSRTWHRDYSWPDTGTG